MRPLLLYKNAFGGLSVNNWYLSLVTLINRSGTMVVPFMTIYCTQQLHFSIAKAGWIMTLFGVGAIAGSYLGGRITDKFGFYKLQLAALVSGGILFILLGYQRTFLSLSICTFFLSLCNESFRPANSSAIISYSTHENRTRSYSLNRFAINLGWSVGGALGGYLASIDYHLLFWVDGCTNILAALLLYKLLPKPEATSIKPESPSITKAASPFRDAGYMAFIAFVVLYAACFFQIFTMQPVFFKSEWLFSEQLIGFLMALNGFTIILFEMVIIHKLEGKRSPLYYTTAGSLITGLGYMLTNMLAPGIAAAVIITILIAFGEILTLPFMNTFWIARTTSSNQGQYAGVYSMAWSTAQIISPIVGSLIILNGGYGLFWWALTASCVVSAGGFLLLKNFSGKIRPRT